MIDPSVRSLRLKLLGAQLREARLSARKGLRETARLIGVSPTTLGSYEAGRKSISLPELELFCLHLQVPIRRFWTRATESAEVPRQMDPAAVLGLRHRTIGALLRAQRQEARWSVRQLSDRVGIPASRISSYERGERGIPLVDLVPVAEAVGHTVEEYLDESGPLADRDSAERVGRAVTGFPPEMRGFLTDPGNLPYLRLALRLSQLPPDQLRQLAADLQVLAP